jgi:F-type H+-transporting ATPase subunit b
MEINIQPSLIIWTVICFGLLMLVLDRLLFRPLLKLMDERKERAESARRRAGEAKLALEARESELALSREAERQRLLKEASEKAEAFRRDSEAELRALSRELEERVARNREEAAKLTDEALADVSASLDGFASDYAQMLTKGVK